MDQASIIRDLLDWLEGHLDQPLSLDNVAAKAGYSKWHLQRMFKEVTGNAIGAYIRARRLSKAAVALRLTSRPILDIALQYRFDSQQTFTRAFKKQFNQTPAYYRRSEEWCSIGICSPIRMGQDPLPEAHFVSIPEKQLVGITQSYSCSLEQLSASRSDLRKHFWTQYLGNVASVPPVLYGLHHSRQSLDKDDEQDILYTTAISPEHRPDNLEGEPITLKSGEYVQFNYEGAPEELQRFILTVYGTCVPKLGLTRRKGYDIEIFHLDSEASKENPPTTFRCEYLIPIIR